MASGLVGFLGSAGAFAPGVGWVLGIAAAVVDKAFLSPMFQDDPDALPEDTLSVPTGPQGIGQPVTVAYGRRIRVPCHVIWQSAKNRDTVATPKQGPGTIERQVFVDAIVALNANKTRRLVQMFGGGRLLMWTDRDLVGITTDGMQAVWSAASTTVTVTMDSTLEVDFENTFAVDNLVRLVGFAATPSSEQSNLDERIWVVTAVNAHSTTPSSIVLEAIEGQSFTLAGTGDAGNAANPARVARIDSARDLWALSQVTSANLQWDTQTIASFEVPSQLAGGPGMGPYRDRFKVGDEVVMRNVVPDVSSNVYRVFGFGAIGGNIETMTVTRVSGTAVGGTGSGYPQAMNVGTTSDRGIIEISEGQQVTPNFFPANYDIASSFYDGSDDQGENPVLIEELGSGNVSAYRGLSYITLEEMNVTQFGGMLPYSLEAILEVDPTATVAGTVSDILISRGILSAELETSGIADEPLEGVFVRGKDEAMSALQPLLFAYKLLNQERDGILSVFSLENADVVTLRNTDSSSYSDLGWKVGADGPPVPKVVFENPSDQKLPTTVNIGFQDPDRLYVRGNEDHSLRNPTSVTGHKRITRIDLESVALRQRDAKDLATNAMRSAWLNAEAFEVHLPMKFLHLLENDIIPFTDDDGFERVGRIISRRVREDWIVVCKCVAEDKDTWFANQAVGFVGEDMPLIWPSNPPMEAVVIDAPAVADDDTDVASLKFAAATPDGGQWSGAAVFESTNNSTWTQVGYLSEPSTMGTLTAAITGIQAETYGSSSVTFDTTNTITIAVDRDNDDLETITDDEAAGGLQWFAILGTETEIIAARTVTRNADGTISFTKTLRGLRGTHANMSHAAGTKVVRLDRGVFRRAFTGGVHGSSTLYYKLVHGGQLLDDATTITVASPAFHNARPLPVRSVTKTIGSSPFDARFTVDAHWCRQLQPLGTQPPHPMDEPFEAYRFDIYDPTGVTLLRQKTITAQGSGSSTLRDKWVDYPATEQLADGYTPSASETFWVDVVQIGQFGDSPSILEEI